MTTVSIVTYRTPLAELRHALKCLADRSVERIYVVDNASEALIKEVTEEFDNVTYIPSGNNGYGAGHNIAIRRAMSEHPQAEFHLVMNSDVDFEPKILSRIERFMAQDPAIGIVQPRIFYPDGRLQYTCRRQPRPFDLLVRLFTPSWMFRRNREAYVLKHLDITKPWNIPFLQGCFMFIRTAALRDAGLFDERFFMYFEDVDLSRRIHRDYLTLYWPGAKLKHSLRAASYHSFKMMGVHMWSAIKYFNKWGWLFDSERRRFNNQISEYVKKSGN